MTTAKNGPPLQRAPPRGSVRVRSTRVSAIFTFDRVYFALMGAKFSLHFATADRNHCKTQNKRRSRDIGCPYILLSYVQRRACITPNIAVTNDVYITSSQPMPYAQSMFAENIRPIYRRRHTCSHAYLWLLCWFIYALSLTLSAFSKLYSLTTYGTLCDAMLFIVRSPCTWLPAHPSVCMYPDNSNAVCVHAFRQPAIAVYIPSGSIYREVDWCLRVPPRLQQAAPAGTQAISLWRRLAHNSDTTLHARLF